MLLRLRTLQALPLLSLFSSVRSTFTFTFSNPTQCDPLSITWSGGQAPFHLDLIPIFGVPRNISIPAAAYSKGKGAVKPQITAPQGHQFFLVMSDATGYASGGVSTLATVGAPVGSASCNTTDPNTAFQFELNSALVQCRTYTISGYTGAAQPVTINGYVPGGDVVTLHPPSGPTSYDWQANIAAGTSIVFTVTDAKGRTGGASDLKISGASDDSSCLKSNSPVSTSGAPGATSKPSSSGSTSGTTIGLAALGGVVGLAVIIALIIFYVRRRSRAKRTLYSSGSYRGKHPSQRIQPVDVIENHDLPADSEPEPEFPSHVTPYSYQAPTSPISDMHFSHVNSTTHDSSYLTVGAPLPPPMTFTGQSKAQQAGLRDRNRPQRFILHTDVEDAVPNDQDDELVELPPQYNENRAQLPPFNNRTSTLQPQNQTHAPDHIPR